MRVALAGLDVVDGGTRHAASTIVFEDGRILAVGRDVPTADRVLDCSGLIAAPGFVELHTHGGGGFALHTEDPAEIAAYARWVPSTGATAFLVNIVGVPDGLPERQLAAAVAAHRAVPSGAEPLGIYLEGPFLNPKRRGAHHPSWLRTPETALVERLLAAAQGHLRVVVLAPELPGAEAVLVRLRDAGVVVSLGHTDASYEQAGRAFALGARLVTHCFNAMPPLLHRAPGPLGALVEHEEVVGELVADGVHVLPPVMRFLVRALGPQRVAAVTDAQPVAGLPPGTTFRFGELQGVVSGDVARLADGTIAGSVLTTEQAVRVLVERVGIPLEDAVTMLATTPARVIGAGHRKGRLLPGYDADLVLLDRSLRLVATFCRGQLAAVAPQVEEQVRPLLETDPPPLRIAAAASVPLAVPPA